MTTTGLLILPLITGACTKPTCTICNQPAERAVVTDESCPVIETICLACAKSAIGISKTITGWYRIADQIRWEKGDQQDPPPNES